MPYPERLKSYVRDDYAHAVRLSDSLGVVCRIANPIRRNGWPAPVEGQQAKDYTVKRPLHAVKQISDVLHAHPNAYCEGMRERVNWE